MGDDAEFRLEVAAMRATVARRDLERLRRSMIGFGAGMLPPGYAVLRVDDHTMWVRLAGDADYDVAGALHWNRWASFRGAWAHHRAATASAAGGQHG